jgi:hypothetical protein
MDESTFDTVLPEKSTVVDPTQKPIPMSNVEQTVIAVAIALVIVFVSSAAAVMKK